MTTTTHNHMLAIFSTDLFGVPTTTKEHIMNITPDTYAICAVCHQPMTFLEWGEHTHLDGADGDELEPTFEERLLRTRMGRHTVDYRLVYQPSPNDEPDEVFEVLEYNPYGRDVDEIVVRTRYGVSRTSTRYLRVVR